ncbi:MAG: HD-GYP domain-containing protein [Alkalispirochaeta sp.]
METSFPGVTHPYYAMAAASLSYLVANTALVAGIVNFTSGERFSRVFRGNMQGYHLQFITMASLAIMLTTLYELSPAFLLLAFVPLTLVHLSAYNYLRLRRDSHTAFKHITDLLSERDEYTGDHSDDVERLAVQLAEAMRMSDEDVEAIRAGAAIHDIGKMAIPDAILNKSGSLDTQEFETMKTHTTIGAEILQNLAIYRNVVPIVLHEHEHWDGSGYPEGLAGEAIPMGARIVAVADVYSALTTERGYRVAQGKPLAYSQEDACTILTDMAGTVLDPTIVEVFLRIVGAPRSLQPR